MSAPDTNTKKQVRRHKGPLGGFVVIAVFIVLLTAAFSIWLLSNADSPEGADEHVRPGIGTVETEDEGPGAQILE